MNTPETFNLEITLPVSVTASLGEDEAVEIMSVTINPEYFNAIRGAKRHLTTEQLREMRAAWLEAKLYSDFTASEEAKASAAETRANRGHLFGG